MARNDDGEFELVLGNRQLISVFLIVVILLGVFFSMGYIVGRNSTPVVVDARNSSGGKPLVVEPPARSAAPPESENTPAQTPAAESKAPESAAPPRPEPVKPSPVKPEPAKSAPELPKPAAEPPKKAPEKPAQTAAGVRSLDEPPAGSYWQVVATTRPEAEIVAEAIAKKGLHAVIAPAPKAGLFRVLVGPLQNAAAMGQARSQLEAAGFKSVIPKKY